MLEGNHQPPVQLSSNLESISGQLEHQEAFEHLIIGFGSLHVA
jgi:hypothetical protein